ncbi:MAG: hypothetical protein KDB65_13370 [Calditrichaeota bacterium]|nr:hypothetical protein [Calditrichota bacterium]
MPKRYIDASILTDGDLASLPCDAFRAWVLLLASTDDFGVVKANPNDVLTGFSSITQDFPVIGRIIQTLTGFSLLRISEVNGKWFFFFKPNSFDRHQYQVRNKRKYSTALNVDATEAQAIRETVFSCQSQDFPVEYRILLEKSFLARATSIQASNIQEKLNNNSENVCLSGNGGLGEKQKRRGRPRKNSGVGVDGNPPVAHSPNGHHDIKSPSASGGTEDGYASTGAVVGLQTGNDAPPTLVPDAVIAILHDIGERTGIQEYQNISAISWSPDLRRKGLEIGFQCLLKQTERFRQHMLAEFENGKLKNKKHNPRAKFMNTWLGRVFDSEKTTGDTEQLTTAPTPPQTKPGEVTGL